MNAQAKDAREKARELQRALYRAAKASATRRFHALYDKVYREDILARAWQEVKANAGSAGVDGQTISAIEERGVAELLAELATELREGRYRPQPVRRVWIPKADGRERPLGIATVRDRVVQASAKLVLEPIFEADFRDSSYGFRPKRNAHQAGEQIRQAVNRGAGWVIDADIEAFFDRIPQVKLVELVEKRVSDRRMLQLLKGWLRVGVLDGGVVTPSDQGVSQGSPISPLLANVVLNELDKLWEEHSRHLGQLIRYCDDFVILCPTEGQAREGLRRAEEILSWLGLRLHPEKTRVVFVGDGREGFDACELYVLAPFTLVCSRDHVIWRLRDERPQRGDQFRQIVGDHRPDALAPDASIRVHQHVSLSNDPTPRDFRMSDPAVIGDLVGCFSDDGKAPLDGHAQHLIALVVVKRHAQRNPLNCSRRFEHVPQIRRIMVVKLHR